MRNLQGQKVYRRANSITRGFESVDAKFPKLVLFDTLLLPSSCMVPTSNRGLLVRLKFSQVNLTDCASVMFQLLLRPTSMLSVPGPRSSLRSPDSPGKASRN